MFIPEIYKLSTGTTAFTHTTISGSRVKQKVPSWFMTAQKEPAMCSHTGKAHEYIYLSFAIPQIKRLSKGFTRTMKRN